MFNFFANLFGYVLNFVYNLVNNYGLAIILFTLLIKILMLPLSIKQQKTMIKSQKLQEKIKILQFKYKNDQEKLNQEMMRLYKEENMSPFSGCLSSIAQFILLISIFYMVRCPLTYMKKVDNNTVNSYIEQLKQAEKPVSPAYPEIDLIREAEFLKEKNPEDENIGKFNINMDFLGIDLSKIPQQNLGDWTVYIIPILYILSTFVTMKVTTSMQESMKNKKNAKEEKIIDGNTGEVESKQLVKKDENEYDMMAQTNKMMSWMMPIMSVSISLVAPLGLALYWLINNIVMLVERLILNKCVKD